MNDLLVSRPEYWPVVLLLPAAALGVAWQRRRVQRARRQLLGPRGEVLLGQPAFGRCRALLGIAAALAFAVVLLQPVGPGPATVAAADVVLCVDVSRSMAARDVAPSRAGAVVAQIERCVAAAPNSRFALVAFAGAAELVVPMTRDGEAVRALAADLVPGALVGGGSDPGAAILLAGELLGPDGGAIVVLGDGEDFAGRGPAAAAAMARAGHVVHTVGVGDEHGSKIVVPGDGGETFLRDASGTEVVTHLELAAQQALAAAGGGAFVRARTGDELRQLHDAVLVPAARAAALRRGTLAPVHRHHLPLLLGLLLWMLRRAVPETRR